jgi:hypothetical protein
MRRRLAFLRAAWWAAWAVREARRSLTTSGLNDVRVARPPVLPPEAGRGVHVVLRRLHSTCLERAVVLQAWLRAQGDDRAIVVGVAGSSKDFRAHAWLEGEQDRSAEFVEIARVLP